LRILDVRSFRGADCDTDYYLVVAKVRERLAVSKQAEQKLDVGDLIWRSRNSIILRLQTGLQPWGT
jgi:hypothetical protein